MKPKSRGTSIKAPVQGAIYSLQHGGRASEGELREIADMSVLDLLSSGLTLEQAETVFKMAAIEIARLSEENRMLPKVPAVETKIKKGKK